MCIYFDWSIVFHWLVHNQKCDWKFGVDNFLKVTTHTHTHTNINQSLNSNKFLDFDFNTFHVCSFTLSDTHFSHFVWLVARTNGAVWPLHSFIFYYLYHLINGIYWSTYFIIYRKCNSLKSNSESVILNDLETVRFIRIYVNW